MCLQLLRMWCLPVQNMGCTGGQGQGAHLHKPSADTCLITLRPLFGVTINACSKPRSDHVRAAEIERVFWRKVLVRPFFLGEATVGPLIYVSRQAEGGVVRGV